LTPQLRIAQFIGRFIAIQWRRKASSTSFVKKKGENIFSQQFDRSENVVEKLGGMKRLAAKG